MTKILIADDEPKIRRGIRSVIEGLGPEYSVVAEAADGEEALAAVRSTAPDVLLVDINMPFLNGLEFIAHIREEYGNTVQIIVISGYDDFEYARKSIALGVYAYILKPVNPKELISVIQRATESLLRQRKDSSYLLWARQQVEKDMPSLLSRFFREWCECLLSVTEINEYRTFLGISLPPILGITGVVSSVSENDTSIGVGAFAEGIVIRRKLLEVVLAAAKPFGLITSFTDTEGRIAVLTSECSGEQWSDLCAEITDRALAVTGRPARVSQIKIDTSIDGPHIGWNSVCDDILDSGNSNAMAELARSFIETNYTRYDLSLEDLADSLKVSPGYASRLLKASTGFGFSVFLNRVRVARALSIITNPQVRLGEVAELVGYQSPHYFCRAFKKIVGITPGEFRDGEVKK